MMSDNSEALEKVHSSVGSRRCSSFKENSEKLVTGRREMAHQAPWEKSDVDLRNRYKTRLATWNLGDLLGNLKIVARKFVCYSGNVGF